MKHNFKFGDWVTILEVDDGAILASSFINRAGQIATPEIKDGESLNLRVFVQEENKTPQRMVSPSEFFLGIGRKEEPKISVKSARISLGKTYKIRPATVDEILQAINSPTNKKI
jgi:hypothetical protein